MREITLAATFSALLIIGGHWFPWRALLHRDLHRVEAYIYGLLSILTPAAVVLWTRGDWFALALIILCTIAAGIATIGAKGIDKIAEYRNELHDRRNRDG